ncbi:MAG: hypothetical protein JKY17_08590 [Magnetovibrio sp.]|nr:hypothetical protein [Magnetovibrio sp.]
MAKSPVTDCLICNGDRVVLRERQVLEHTILRDVCDPDLENGFRQEAVSVITELGGVDACPDCTKRAEAFYHPGQKSIDPDPNNDLAQTNIRNLAHYRRRTS